MKTIYLDISTLLGFPAMTGIQRVVSEAAVRLIADQKSRGYRLVLLWHNRDYQFAVCDNDKFMSCFMFSEGEKMACITQETITIDQLAPSSFWLDMDSVWVSMLPRHLLYPQLKKRNIQIGVYVYDIISITHPQYCSAENYIRFPAYMGAVYDYADYIFTEAQYTLDEIRRIQQEIGCGRTIEYRLAVPGGNFLGGGTESAQIDEPVRKIAKRGKILLTVSTLEIRKNHKVLLDAFDAGLCAMGYQMVFVGKIGWKVDELAERIRSHPENGKTLFHLQGIDDNTLHFLYQNADFVLFPSYIEGYGLSTVEALQYGVPTILSDVPIMREVGGAFCDYFDPDAPAQLIDIIRRYEVEPERYAAKKESLKQYVPPTWDGCAASILESILQFRPAPCTEHRVEQLVCLSARADAMLHTLEHVEHFMPFIKKVVLLCPDAMVDKTARRYQGRLAITYITDSELLDGRPLPEDHTHRNFLLRCLAMHRPELDAEFIMSDDDYRPLAELGPEFFIRNGRYQAFYFHDLDLWQNAIQGATSYDLSMLRSNRFLTAHNYPNLQYASHMPQVIRKEWYLDMLREHPGLEETGCCEWSTYFNYSIAHYPECFDVRPYTVVAWPEMISSWDIMVAPPEYAFENFYDFLYGEGQPFSGMSMTYHDAAYLENAKKIIINRREMEKAAAVKRQWRGFENYCNTVWKQFPSFVLCCEEGKNPEFRNLPPYLELLGAGAYSFLVSMMEKDASGRWAYSRRDLRIGYGWEGWDELFVSRNINGCGRALIRVLTPAGRQDAELKLFYGVGEGPLQHLCTIPVRFSEKREPVSTAAAPAANAGRPQAAGDALAAPLNYVNRNYEIPYYWTLGPRGLKTFAKRVMRKLMKCIIPVILERQNKFNRSVVQCLNHFRSISQQNASEAARCQQGLRALQASVQEQGRQIDALMNERELNRSAAEETAEALKRQLEALEKAFQAQQPLIEERFARQEKVLAQQSGSFREMHGVIDGQLEEIRRRGETAEHQMNELRARHEVIDGQLEEIRKCGETAERQMNELRARGDVFAKRLDTLSRQSDAFSASAAKTILECRKEAGLPVEAPVAAPAEPAVSGNAYIALDYFKFQNDFRGTRALIAERQEMYVRYFQGCKLPVLDIGCGRGEFLHLMREHKIPAFGIDLYPEYVIEGRINGLDVRQGDGIAFLQRTEQQLGGVFACQVIEHIDFAQLQTLCKAAYERLVSGGYLILETPNPCSLSIFTNSFYADPTHNKPVHPQTLRYLLSEIGFEAVNILYTECSRPQPLPHIQSDSIRNLDQVNAGISRVSDMLFGSRDYAVIAKKP